MFKQFCCCCVLLNSIKHQPDTVVYKHANDTSTVIFYSYFCFPCPQKFLKLSFREYNLYTVVVTYVYKNKSYSILFSINILHY